MKKVMLIVLGLSVTLLVTSCKSEESLPRILDLFSLSKQKVLNKLGDDYEVVPSGPDGGYEGYYYEDLDYNIIFIDDEFIDYIELGEINGVPIGATFEEVMKTFGDTEIKEITYKLDNVLDVEEYEANYTIEGHLLSFIANSNNKNVVDEIIMYNAEKGGP